MKWKDVRRISRGLVGDDVLSFGWMIQANYEQHRQQQGMGKIMETLHNKGIKLFVLAALKEC